MMTRLAEQMKMTEIAVPAADWLKQLRAAGAGRFKAVGFPAKDTEEWRHTQLGPIVSTPFRVADAAVPQAANVAAGEFTFGNESAVELVFVAGRFVPQLSKLKALPRGARVMNLADAVERHGDVVEPHLGKLADLERNPFVALNTGNLADGAFIHLAKGALVEPPIHLLFISTP